MAALWIIGSSTFCKVKVWCKGLESKNSIIQLVVKNAPDVSVPEVICSWVHHNWGPFLS